jgi:predicted MFS family arabinose efflux permease
LAYDLAGARAGEVLGTALAIKMVAYVGLGPVAGALAAKLPRKAFLICLDLARAGLILLLPFVTQVWQIYVLVFLFQACSACFTPTFQATIPDVLKDERAYTKALSLSRLAYDLESLVSPLFAGLLLSVMSFHWLFVGTGIGFVASALLVTAAAVPTADPSAPERPFRERLTRGLKIYLRTPRLRGLFALSLAVSSAGAMVIVNSVIYARDLLGGGEREVAWLFAAYGLGSMAVALAMPPLLDRIRPRTAMIGGASLLALALPLGAMTPGAGWLHALWTTLGVGSALIMTPAGLILRQSSHAEDRPPVFAAQFALSHAWWLLAYPAAGWLGTTLGLGSSFLALTGGVVLGLIGAALLWPADDPEEIEHEHSGGVHAHRHPDRRHHDEGAAIWREDGSHVHRPIRHRHRYVIDDHHPEWPR